MARDLCNTRCNDTGCDIPIWERADYTYLPSLRGMFLADLGKWLIQDSRLLLWGVPGQSSLSWQSSTQKMGLIWPSVGNTGEETLHVRCSGLPGHGAFWVGTGLLTRCFEMADYCWVIPGWSSSESVEVYLEDSLEIAHLSVTVGKRLHVPCSGLSVHSPSQ